MKNQSKSIRMKSAVILLALIAFFTQNVLGEQEERNLSDFNQISFNIAGDLILTQGNKFKVIIEGSKNEIAKVITEAKGGKLIIKTKHSMNTLKNIKVYVTLPALESVVLSGSGDVFATKKFEVGHIKLALSGSGDIKFDELVAKDIKTAISGSGDISLKGSKSSTLNISIAGSGDFNSVELEAADVKVSISGSGTARVFASGTLNANIVGSGDVLYKGKPLVNSQAVGSGSTRSL